MLNLLRWSLFSAVCVLFPMPASAADVVLPPGVKVEENPTDAKATKIVLIAGSNYFKPGEHEYIAGCAAAGRSSETDARRGAGAGDRLASEAGDAEGGEVGRDVFRRREEARPADGRPVRSDSEAGRPEGRHRRACTSLSISRKGSATRGRVCLGRRSRTARPSGRTGCMSSRRFRNTRSPAA